MVGALAQCNRLSIFNMAARNMATAVHKLHAVTLVRSRIGRPWWEKRTLRALGLQFINQTRIHKNTPRVNGQLARVKNLIRVTPVVLNEEGLESELEEFKAVDLEKLDFENVEPVGPFLDSLGRFDLKSFLEYHRNVLKNKELKEEVTSTP